MDVHIVSYIYYQVLNLIFELRRRLPLYANDLGADLCVEFYDPKDHHAAPYSKGDSFVSGACDRLGADFMAQALKAPSVRRFIPKILDEDLALDISDIIYRPIQRFYAALRSVETQSKTRIHKYRASLRL